MKRLLRWEMCKCELNGLVRPNGAVKIRCTEVRTPDVLVAKLSGAVRGEVVTVRCGERYFYVAPEKAGGGKDGIREVPADSLTDGLHSAIYDLNEEKKRQRRRSKK